MEMNRRRFLQVVGSASLLGAARPGWASLMAAPRRASFSRFVYIGAADGIHVYSTTACRRFTHQQTMASAHPVAMAIGAGHLYVANGISEHGNLPRGSVEAYAIDAATGRLELKNRVPLSLSGILPRDLAIAPDGRSVVVAIHGGGAYNVLSLLEDKRLGRVSGIYKETGSGPQRAAHPSAVIFDAAGRVLTADEGSDRLSVFSLSDGRLTAAARREVPAGSGPRGMVLHPDGSHLYVANALNGTVSSFAYEGGTLDHRQTVSIGSEVAGLAMHPSGETLYAAHRHGVRVWKIAADGGVEALPGVEGIHVSSLHVMPGGRSLLALSHDAVLGMKIDESGHVLAGPVNLASVSNPVSIAVI
jgi:6-phosphogluconolactonase (cycloisomerase 2 family)